MSKRISVRLLSAVTVIMAALMSIHVAEAQIDRPPSWAVGTFKGHNRKYDLDVEIRITARGTVTRYIRKDNGRPESTEGSWNNGELVFGTDRFIVSQTRDGIRTVKASDDNDTTSLRSTASGPGPGRPDDDGSTAVPTWAVGTFRGHNRKYDLDVEMRITARGSVKRYIRNDDNRDSRPDAVEGSWKNGELIFGADRYTVSRTRDGIRTVKASDDSDTTSLRRTGEGRPNNEDDWDFPTRPQRPPRDIEFDQLHDEADGTGNYTLSGRASDRQRVKNIRVDLERDGTAKISVETDEQRFTLYGKWFGGRTSTVRLEIKRGYNSSRDNLSGTGTLSLRNSKEVERLSLNYRQERTQHLLTFTTQR